VIGLDSNVVVRYLAQDDARQAAIATRLIEGSLSTDDRRVAGLLSAPQLMMERADVLWRALKAYRESKADFSDAIIVELGSDAGCSKTVTFDQEAAKHPGFEALR
jgi:predicted nucleic-acid-binding protein